MNKITLFCPDEDTEMKEPTIVYYVEDAPTPSHKDGGSAAQANVRRDLILAADDPPMDEDALWVKCRCRGEKLTEGCQTSKDEATEFTTPLNMPWKGTMEAELKKWGYHERPPTWCSLDDIENALNDLKIEEGDTNCYEVRYLLPDGTKDEDGKVIAPKDQTYTVDKKTYRVSNTHSL